MISCAQQVIPSKRYTRTLASRQRKVPVHPLSFARRGLPIPSPRHLDHNRQYHESLNCPKFIFENPLPRRNDVALRSIYHGHSVPDYLRAYRVLRARSANILASLVWSLERSLHSAPLLVAYLASRHATIGRTSGTVSCGQSLRLVAWLGCEQVVSNFREFPYRVLGPRVRTNHCWRKSQKRLCFLRYPADRDIGRRERERYRYLAWHFRCQTSKCAGEMAWLHLDCSVPMLHILVLHGRGNTHPRAA